VPRPTNRFTRCAETEAKKKGEQGFRLLGDYSGKPSLSMLGRQSQGGRSSQQQYGERMRTFDSLFCKRGWDSFLFVHRHLELVSLSLPNVNNNVEVSQAKSKRTALRIRLHSKLMTEREIANS